SPTSDPTTAAPIRRPTVPALDRMVYSQARASSLPCFDPPPGAGRPHEPRPAPAHHRGGERVQSRAARPRRLGLVRPGERRPRRARPPPALAAALKAELPGVVVLA